MTWKQRKFTRKVGSWKTENEADTEFPAQEEARVCASEKGPLWIRNAMSGRQCPCLDSAWVICTSILVQQGLPVDHIPGTKMENGSTFLHTLSMATSRAQGPLLSVTCPSPVIRLRCLQPWRLSAQRRKRRLVPSIIYQKPFRCTLSVVLLIFCLYYPRLHLTTDKGGESCFRMPLCVHACGVLITPFLLWVQFL